MSTPRLLQLLHRVGGEFWLPLPLIAGLVWFTGNCMAARVLNGAYDSVNKLQAGTQLTTKRSVTILTMNAEIDRQRGLTTLVIKTTAPTVQRLEYEFPFTQASQIEAAIAKELAMPIADVRKSIGYRIKD
ncbi:hypothetical protein [Chamaesiphon sp.]|uniref:hypothetical protein n=1 Tax=Chamaesiphon sp. TaxID=2814140 RepID=UPI003594732F